MGDSQILGNWTHLERKLHINCLDLKAVILALRPWVTVLWGHQVMIAMDHTTVLSYINKQDRTHSHTLLHLVVDLFLRLQTQHIASEQAHSRLSECHNRPPVPANQPITTEWSLHPEIVTRIFEKWDTLTVVIFATVNNTHLPQFISPILELPCTGDRCSVTRQGRLVYMFSQFPLLNKVTN